MRGFCPLRPRQRVSSDDLGLVLGVQSLTRCLCDLHLVGEGQDVRNDVVCIGGIDDARDQESVAKTFKSSPHVAGQGFRVLTRKSVDKLQLQIEDGKSSFFWLRQSLMMRVSASRPFRITVDMGPNVSFRPGVRLTPVQTVIVAIDALPFARNEGSR